jgi:hypothetical protein
MELTLGWPATSAGLLTQLVSDRAGLWDPPSAVWGLRLNLHIGDCPGFVDSLT